MEPESVRDSRSAAADDGDDPLRRVRDLLEMYRNGGPPQLLVDATQLMLATPPRQIIDPERTQLAFDLADRLNDLAATQSRLDVLDAGLQLVNAELATIDSHIDLTPDALLRMMRGVMLTERHYLNHRYEDLASSLNELERVTALVRQLPQLLDDHRRAWLWYSYGSARLRQADISKRLDQLGQAVEALEQARDIEGARPYLRAGIRRALALARPAYWRRVVRADQTAQPRLDQAIDESIVELTDLADNAPGEAVDRAGWLQNLALLHLERATRPGRSDADRDSDLAAGLAAVERGLVVAPKWDDAQVTLRGARADILRARDKDSTAVEETLRAAYEAAVAHQHPDMAIAGGNWLFYCASHDRWRDAAAVGERTMAAVERLVRRQPHQHYKRVVLRDTAHLAGRAAYALVREGRPTDAAVMLERSQAVVLTDRYVKPRVIEHALNASGHRDLALEYAAAASVFRNQDAPDEVLRQAEDRLAALTERLGDLPGVAALIQEVDAATLAANTAGVVVAYLTASRFGGLALVTDGTGEFHAIELPEATEQQVWRVAARFMQWVVAPSNPPILRARTIAATCGWLDRAIMNVLTRELGVGTPVVLIPTGKLVGLPFHAAQASRAEGRSYALADRQYTYAPSAALIGPPADLSERSLSALVVAEPARAVEQRLAGMAREVDAVARAFARPRVLSGPAATRDTVVAALRQAGLAHLACHAVSDPKEPMRSALLLAGEDTLRLEELLADPVKDLRLAVLSACQTAVTDRDLPGESLSLAAGLRAVGAQGVIGSLWPVWSDATAALMERFYDAVATGVAPAEALRQAQLALATGAAEAPVTDETGMAWSDPYFWAGFVYFGR